MDEAMDMRFDMVAQGKALGELLPDMCRQVYDIAEKWNPPRTVTVRGNVPFHSTQ